MNADEQGFVAGTGIESQDLVTVADKMAQSILGIPQIANAVTPPTIVLEPVDNQTRFPINKDLFLTRIRAELNKQARGKVQFLARNQMAALEKERNLKREGSVTAAADPTVQEFKGADFFLTGTLGGLSTRTKAGTSDYNPIRFPSHRRPHQCHRLGRPRRDQEARARRRRLPLNHGFLATGGIHHEPGSTLVCGRGLRWNAARRRRAGAGTPHPLAPAWAPGAWAAPLLLALLLSACATTPQVPLTGNVLVDGPNAIANGPPRDKVLWQYRTALADLRQGNQAEAKKLLDDALMTVQGIYGADPDARKSRGFFTPESRKTFIGEPYERSMAYIYRGFLYWADGQYDNARACFRSAEFEDSDTADHQYAGDWVLPDYLDGLASTLLQHRRIGCVQARQGPFPQHQFAPVQRQGQPALRRRVRPRAAQIRHGLLWRRTPVPAARPPRLVNARIIANGVNQLVAPCDDLNFQATTRGGRVMDHVLAKQGRVQNRDRLVAGDVALIGGLATAAASRDRTTQAVGLGVAAAGLVTKIVSAAATPQADVRTWDNLPQFLSFATVSLPPGSHQVTVQFLDRGGNPRSAVHENAYHQRLCHGPREAGLCQRPVSNTANFMKNTVVYALLVAAAGLVVSGCSTHDKGPYLPQTVKDAAL